MASRIERAVATVLTKFGKLGILIDDDGVQGAHRVAREMYGAEALPSWWITCGSVVCAAQAIEAFRRHGPTRYPAVVLFDRLLPLECRERARPVRWDDEEVEHGQEAKTLNHAAEEIHRGLWDGVLGEFQTSFPDTLQTSKWKPRASAVLSGLRATIVRRQEKDLLRFGPVTLNAPSDEPLVPIEDGDRTRRSHWMTAIDEIAGRLEGPETEQGPVVLLTGAGASLSVRPGAPGMPLTGTLLIEALSLMSSSPTTNAGSNHVTSKRRGDASGAKASVDAHRCVCRDVTVKSTGRQYEITSAGQLIDLFDQKQKTKEPLRGDELRFDLLTLFRTFDTRARKLAYALRVAMFRHDTSFSFHHWLLAQLPWKAIVTTNFDSFHERAAIHAAGHTRARAQRDQSFRLAMPGEWFEKMYGSLSEPKLLALNEDQIERKWPKAEVLRRFKKTIPGTLVVLGHAMSDRLLESVIVDELSDWSILWVVPSAYSLSDRRASGQTGRSLKPWLDLVAKSQSAARGNLGPLDGTAIDFAYDLFASYQSREKRRSASA